MHQQKTVDLVHFVFRVVKMKGALRDFRPQSSIGFPNYTSISDLAENFLPYSRISINNLQDQGLKVLNL